MAHSLGRLLRGWLLLPVLWSCSGEPQTATDGQDAPPRSPPDLILVLTPGLRADVTTPGAEQALFEGLGALPWRRFTRAYAQSCSPHTSMGSLLTGLYPSAIPLCGSYAGDSLVPNSEESPWCSELPERRYTLPEVVELYGYTTAAWVPDPDVEGHTPWAALGEQVGAWWQEHEASPRLLVLSVLDLQLLQFDPAIGFTAHDRQHDRKKVALDTEAIRERYETLARATGVALGELLDELPQGPGRDRVVALTSTNGMNLAEESGVRSDHLLAVTHSIIVDRTIHVPLALAGPGIEAGSDERLVELVDLLPTLSSLAGAVPPTGLPGSDLLLTEPLEPTPIAYAEFGDMLALREGNHLLTFRYFLHNATSLDPRITEGLLEFSLNEPNFFTL
ncbi:MAG: hypothetical protein QGG40_17210, partial [Myxococcota bacterium]|nr:hypothetical protein [Myxococcota bacterium]